MWSFFLASSTIVSRQGGASVYQLTLHKNTNGFDRSLGVKSHVGLRFADDKAWKCVDPSSRRAPFLLQEADPPFQTLTLPPPHPQAHRVDAPSFQRSKWKGSAHGKRRRKERAPIETGRAVRVPRRSGYCAPSCAGRINGLARALTVGDGRACCELASGGEGGNCRGSDTTRAGLGRKGGRKGRSSRRAGGEKRPGSSSGCGAGPRAGCTARRTAPRSARTCLRRRGSPGRAPRPGRRGSARQSRRR